MRIRQIIYNSLGLPFKEYKLFLILILLALVCEILYGQISSLDLGKWSFLMLVANAIVALIILGLMMNLTYRVVSGEEIEVNLKEYLIEGTKEYIVTMYYVLLTVIASSFFIVPTGVYSRLMHINEYIARMDINTTFLTLSELSHELPVSLQVDLQRSIQLNVLIAIILFIFFSSMGFIGKALLYNTGKMGYAFDVRKILVVIRNIGVLRYLKFVFCIGLVIVTVFNTVFLLEYLFADVIISAIIEAFTLIFSTNAFYLICVMN